MSSAGNTTDQILDAQANERTIKPEFVLFPVILYCCLSVSTIYLFPFRAAYLLLNLHPSGSGSSCLQLFAPKALRTPATCSKKSDLPDAILENFPT